MSARANVGFTESDLVERSTASPIEYRIVAIARIDITMDNRHNW